MYPEPEEGTRKKRCIYVGVDACIDVPNISANITFLVPNRSLVVFNAWGSSREASLRSPKSRINNARECTPRAMTTLSGSYRSDAAEKARFNLTAASS